MVHINYCFILSSRYLIPILLRPYKFREYVVFYFLDIKWINICIYIYEIMYENWLSRYVSTLVRLKVPHRGIILIILYHIQFNKRGFVTDWIQTLIIKGSKPHWILLKSLASEWAQFQMTNTRIDYRTTNP